MQKSIVEETMTDEVQLSLVMRRSQSVYLRYDTVRMTLFRVLCVLF